MDNNEINMLSFLESMKADSTKEYLLKGRIFEKAQSTVLKDEWLKIMSNLPNDPDSQTSILMSEFIESELSLRGESAPINQLNVSNLVAHVEKVISQKNESDLSEINQRIQDDIDVFNKDKSNPH